MKHYENRLKPYCGPTVCKCWSNVTLDVYFEPFICDPPLLPFSLRFKESHGEYTKWQKRWKNLPVLTWSSSSDMFPKWHRLISWLLSLVQGIMSPERIRGKTRAERAESIMVLFVCYILTPSSWEMPAVAELEWHSDRTPISAQYLRANMKTFWNSRDKDNLRILQYHKFDFET